MDIMTKLVVASVRISIRVCYGQKRTLLNFNAAFKPMKRLLRTYLCKDNHQTVSDHHLAIQRYLVRKL